MLKPLLNDRETQVLKTMLDITSTRHRVLANNIANADTPGFKRSDVEFREELAAALSRRDLQGLAELRPRVITMEAGSALRNDGNNVDMDTEMVEMSKNYLLYNINAQLLSKHFMALKAAIAGRV